MPRTGRCEPDALLLSLLLGDLYNVGAHGMAWHGKADWLILICCW